jgi:2-phospho-L-lactate transferase/gluconeogenesis factor (CofD/UPF0052 family)
MNIREARDQAIRKVKPLNERLSRQFGVSLDLTSDEDHLRRVMEHYDAKRDDMIVLRGQVEAMSDSDYAKAVMISEMVRMLLREIAPKRKKKKKK